MLVRAIRVNAGWPTAREGQGHGVSVVVRAREQVTSYMAKRDRKVIDVILALQHAESGRNEPDATSFCYYSKRAINHSNLPRCLRGDHSAAANRPRVQKPAGNEEPRGRHQERRDRPHRQVDPEVGRAPDDVDDRERGPDAGRARSSPHVLVTGSCATSHAGPGTADLRTGAAGRAP